VQGSTSFNAPVTPVNNVAFEQPVPCTVHTMSGLDSLKDVALRPWPADKEDESSKDVVFRKIEQLATERGHMRNITEQSLQADVDAGKDALDDAKDGSEEEDEGLKSKTFEERRDEIMKMQWEMAMHLEYV
jgi:mediator of RNA polymerase II transcription subunit 17